MKEITFGLSSLLILLMLGFDIWRSENASWKSYQQTYYKKLFEKTGDKNVLASPIKIQQIWNAELGLADRCHTCHLGIANPNFQNEPQPFTTHPLLSDYMGKHPFDKFGCTVCHQGDGQALRYENTHGHVEHMDHQPLTGMDVQTACTKCHRYLHAEEVSFPQTPELMEGKRLAMELGCRACHTSTQMGWIGTTAPDLSDLGTKTELAFYLVHDFGYVEGEHSKRQWEWEHFKDPQKIVPGNPAEKVPPTIMPHWGLNDAEATALTVLVLSFRDPKREKIPLSYIPKLPPHEGFLQYTAK